ncbi:MAG: hypothetical protein AAGA91_06990 [Pseudomonadota bacterium]
MQQATEPKVEFPLASPTIYMEQLSEGAQLVVWSMRQWVVSAQKRRCPGCDLKPAYARYPVDRAVEYFLRIMNLIANDAKRTIYVQHPEDGLLGADELILLRMIRLTQRQSPRHAQRLGTQLIHARAPFMCSIAKAYRGELEAAGLSLDGWHEMQLVTMH